MTPSSAGPFRLLAVFLALGTTSCTTMEVRTATDPQSNLAKYSTYAWAPPNPSTQGRPPSILDQTLKSSLERALATKGLTLAKPSEAQLLVTYFGGARDTVHYSTAGGYGYWGYPYSYPYYATPYVTREGSLTLQFYDSRQKRIVWQGTATDVISETGASQEQVAHAVQELMARFPAG